MSQCNQVMLEKTFADIEKSKKMLRFFAKIVILKKVYNHFIDWYLDYIENISY